MKKWTILFLLVFLLSSCSKQEEKVLMVLAAASMQEPLKEMQEIFEQSHDVRIQFQFGGSGMLAQQVAQGAPADVYIAADKIWMRELAEKNLIQPSSLRTIAANKLVLIGQQASPTIKDLAHLDVATNEQIAIGHPDTVPAGAYTKQVLEQVDKWQALEGNLIYTSDVRQALTYVETANVSYGFVYETDARLSEEVAIILDVPTHLHDPIHYPAAIVADTSHEDLAAEWLELLTSETGKTIMEQYHFKRN